MRTYIVKTNHYFQDLSKARESNIPREHTHRVPMPHKVWLDLKKKHSTAIWPFHSWVEKQLEKQIGSRHDGERYTSRYYIKSIKVEK